MYRLCITLISVHFQSFRPSTLILLNHPLRASWTVYFHPQWLSSFLPLDRPVFLLLDRPLFDFRTVHFLGPRPSTFRSLDCTVQPLDRPLWPKTIHFRPDPLYQFTFPTSNDLSKFIWNFPTSLSLSKFNLNFPTSVVLSNFSQNFPTLKETSLGSFQLHLALSNFSESFQLQTFQFKTSTFPSFQLRFPTTRTPQFTWILISPITETKEVISFKEENLFW